MTGIVTFNSTVWAQTAPSSVDYLLVAGGGSGGGGSRNIGDKGGAGGGQIIATGTPDDVAKNEASFTGHYLAPLLIRKTITNKKKK